MAVSLWAIAALLAVQAAVASSRDLLQAHDAAYQRWVPAQGPHTGCECLPQWSYTATNGTKYNINGTCANPGNDWNTDWCYVNPMTCQHKPFLANNGQVTAAWDSCMGPGLNTTIDAEKTLDFCSCQPSYNWTSVNGTNFNVTDGSCIQDDPNVPAWCIVVEKSCSQPPPTKPDGQKWDICRGVMFDYDSAAAKPPSGPQPPRPETASGCTCLPHWNYTAPGTNDTQFFNGTCGTPGAKTGGPWCYVEPATCTHAPLKDQSGQSYDNCATLNSTHTMDTAKTVNYCNCLPAYNYTSAAGQTYNITNGTCIRTSAAELPWCFVVEDTCITPVLHRNGLGKNDSAWDTCLNTGTTLSYIMPPSATAAGASASNSVKLGLAIGLPVAFVVVALLSVCYAYTVYKKKRARKAEELAKKEALLDDRPWGVDVLQAYMDKQDKQGGRKDSDDASSGGKIGTTNNSGPSPTTGTASSVRTDGSHPVSDTTALLPGGGRNKTTSRMSGASSLPEVVPSSSWEINPEEIVIAKHPDGRDWEIGHGGFGKVYRATWNEVQTVAVKQLLQHDARNDIRFLREIAILKECRSTHVVQFLGACVAPGSTMLVCELMEGGSCHDLLRRGALTWAEGGLDIAKDVVRGLSYLHQNRIAHLDIKSGNVLLTREGKAKIADVGLAQMVQTTHISNLNGMGTFAYAAPELLTGGKCNEAADIFSFGVLLWELVSGEIPRRGKLRELRVGSECSEEVPGIIEDCMQIEVALRPTAKDLVGRLEALPPQPNPRPKRQSSAGSFNSYISPLDRAAQHSSDNSSSALSGDSLKHSGSPLSAGSQSASGYNFYQGNTEGLTQGYSVGMSAPATMPLAAPEHGANGIATNGHKEDAELPVSVGAGEEGLQEAATANPATEALEAAKAAWASSHDEAAAQDHSGTNGHSAGPASD